MSSPALQQKSKVATLLVAALVVYAVAIVRTAWLAEDAYITLRTVDNFVHGYGLRWNVGERVQSYTHPLWMFVVAAFYAITRESFFTVLTVNIVVSMAAVFVLAFRVARSPGHAIAAVAILTLSRAFTDFSTGGFENGLSHLLLGIFALLFLVRGERLRPLSLIAALIACNRLDAVLIIAPALAISAWQFRKECGLLACSRELLIGFSPLLAWEAFSLLYYGFPFPNTAYVKIATGISRLATVQQGATYLLSSMEWDPVLIAGMLGGVVLACIEPRSPSRWLALGAVLYVGYLVYIGGDFMKGRFLTAPFYVLVCIIARSEVAGARAAGWSVAAALGCLQLAPAFQSRLPEPTLEDPYQPGVVDERAHYNGSTSLVTATRTRVMPSHRWANEGRRVKASGTTSYVSGHMGLLGYFAGPRVHIIDYHALTDAFLAHVPPMRNARWIIGHFRRTVPEGYEESARDGRCHMTEPDLCEFFERMHLIIAGPLLSWERLVTIARMNAGAYDHLVDSDRFRLPELAHAAIGELATPVLEGREPDGKKREPVGTRTLTESGLDVDLGSTARAPAIAIALDSDDDYSLEFFAAGASLGRVVVAGDQGGGMRNRRVSVPRRARQRGYDRIRILPERGDGKYHIGNLHLQN